MRAYAVFDGGGVKGAALAGCLAAAQNIGIEFVGYGGTSAGSIVALLAAVGYSGKELRDVLVETPLTDLLDDRGEALKRITGIISGAMRSFPSFAIRALGLYRLGRQLWDPLGVYKGRMLRVSSEAGVGQAGRPGAQWLGQLAVGA